MERTGDDMLQQDQIHFVLRGGTSPKSPKNPDNSFWVRLKSNENKNKSKSKIKLRSRNKWKEGNKCLVGKTSIL